MNITESNAIQAVVNWLLPSHNTRSSDDSARKALRYLADRAYRKLMAGRDATDVDNDWLALAAAREAGERRLQACAEAIEYTLRRAQESPNLGYEIGPGTEAFRLLCAAEAHLHGVDAETVERERGKALWGTRKSERDMLRQRIAELEAE